MALRHLKQVVYHNITADIAGAVVVTHPVNIREISGRNNTLGDIYLQLFNAIAAPANGTATGMLIAPLTVPAGDPFDLVFADASIFPNGLVADTGLYVCASSTKYTKTLAVAPTIDLTVIYDEFT